MLNKDQISQIFSQSHSSRSNSMLCIAERDVTSIWNTGFENHELVNTYSVSKLIVTLAVYSAWEAGLIDFDQPVRYYWPEFEQHGKSDVTVRHVMEHTSGLPYFGEQISTQDTYDWDYVCSVLARTPLLHAPGTEVAYHARTYGFLLGEVIQRATGGALSDFVQTNLSVDENQFYFGVPKSELGKVKRLYLPIDIEIKPHAYQAIHARPIPHDAAPYGATVFQNPINDILAPNDEKWLSAAIPSSGGVSNAVMIVEILRNFFATHPRSRTAIYALTKENKLPRTDKALGIPVNWIAGFEANNGEFGIGPTRFGYRAIGGSIAFFDLHRELFVSYTTSLMVPQPGLHPAHDPRIEKILEIL